MNVMKMAWRFATAAQVKFGGSKKDYMKQSLVLAHKMIRAMKAIFNFKNISNVAKADLCVKSHTETNGTMTIEIGNFVIKGYKDRANVRLIKQDFYEAIASGDMKWFASIMERTGGWMDTAGI